MPILDTAYNGLASLILAHGYIKPSRVGETLSLPGTSIATWHLKHEFPILTTRKIFHKGVIGELAAFLQGATTVKEFEDLGCPYWRHNASQWYPNKQLKPEDWIVGEIYGYQWRHWGPHDLDQIKVLVHGLKRDPYGRRHILTTWDPDALDAMCLPPCHLLAQFYAYQDRLDCVVYMRSVDIALGLPSDLVLYGALLMLVAKEVDRVPGRLHMQFGDAHIYKEHILDLQRQIMQKIPTKRPFAELHPDATLDTFHPDHFTLYDYEPLEAIKYELL